MNSTVIVVQKFPRLKSIFEDFPGSPVAKNLPSNAGNMGLTPVPERSHALSGN